MNIDGIIFDLDGTLWDSCRVVSESWSQTLRRISDTSKGPSPEDIRGIMGMTADQIASSLFSHYGDRAFDICKQCIRGENEYIALHSGDLYPGVKEILPDLSLRYPLFIVSNCLEGYIECFLESSGLSAFFTDHLCEGDTGLKKAGNITLIAQRNRICHPIYIGDTSQDEASAREAACPFVFASYGFGNAVHPDAVIHSFPELLEILPLLAKEAY